MLFLCVCVCAKACKTTQCRLWRSPPPPYNTELHGEEDQPAPALHVGRRGFLQAALSKQKVHDTENAPCCNWRFAWTLPGHSEVGPRRLNTASFFFSRRQELIQLPLLNNAKVKRNGNYGVALWKHRHGGATPFCVPEKKTQAAEQPRFPPTERTTALLNHILCLLQ